MTLDTLTLEQTTDGYKYEMYPIQEVRESQEKPGFSIAPPGQNAANNVFVGVQGQQADIEIDVTIWDDGSDRSKSTAPAAFTNSTVVSVTEQVTWLRDPYMQKANFSVAWELSDSVGFYNNDEVYFESWDTPTVSQSPWKQATLRLRRGSSV